MVLSRRVFATRGVLLVMKILEDERYVVIKAYKCTVSEIWRDSFVLAYIACIRRIPTYRVYRLCDISLLFGVTILCMVARWPLETRGHITACA